MCTTIYRAIISYDRTKDMFNKQTSDNKQVKERSLESFAYVYYYVFMVLASMYFFYY